MILDSHPRISCGEETHFLRELEPITGKHWRMLEPYGFPREYWLERVRGLYTGFQADYLARRGKARWAEKDPTYTLLLPYIGELFPDALYLHLVRDGHDVVASYRDRWGYKAAARVARGEWKRYVTAARALRDGPAADRYLELRYEDLVADPEGVAAPAVRVPGRGLGPGRAALRRAAARRLRALPAVHRGATGGGRRVRRDLPLPRGLRRRDGWTRCCGGCCGRSSGALLRDLGYLDGGR